MKISQLNNEQKRYLITLIDTHMSTGIITAQRLILLQVLGDLDVSEIFTRGNISIKKAMEYSKLVENYNT